MLALSNVSNIDGSNKKHRKTNTTRAVCSDEKCPFLVSIPLVTFELNVCYQLPCGYGQESKRQQAASLMSTSLVPKYIYLDYVHPSELDMYADTCA